MTPKLKQLCTAHTLAATIATGMLVSSIVLAQDCTSAAAYPLSQFYGCGANQTECTGPDPCPRSLGSVYWCCQDTQTCGAYTTAGTCDLNYPPPPPYAYGWCCPSGGGQGGKPTKRVRPPLWGGGGPPPFRGRAFSALR